MADDTQNNTWLMAARVRHHYMRTVICQCMLDMLHVSHHLGLGVGRAMRLGVVVGLSGMAQANVGIAVGTALGPGVHSSASSACQHVCIHACTHVYIHMPVHRSIHMLYTGLHACLHTLGRPLPFKSVLLDRQYDEC